MGASVLGCGQRLLSDKCLPPSSPHSQNIIPTLFSLH